MRRHVGYQRYSTKAAYELLLKLYPLLSLQMNFLRPVRKLIALRAEPQDEAKERLGARVIKRYDEPQTPYKRLLASGVLAPTAQAEMEKQSLRVNPLELQKRIDQLLHQLWELADRWREGKLVNVG